MQSTGCNNGCMSVGWVQLDRIPVADPGFFLGGDAPLRNDG